MQENIKEELLDVLDENGNKTGEILSRKEIHKRGLWHRLVIIAIINENNEILLQQRSSIKEKNPNMWDISVAGHLSAGQDSLSGAVREINEEVAIDLGYKVDIREFRFMYSYRTQEIVNENYIDKQYWDFFVLRKNGIKAENIRVQESEVQQVKFVTASELKQLIDDNKIVQRPHLYETLFEYLFKMI